MENTCTLYVVPDKIHTHPMEGHWKFPGGGGVLKAKFLETVYENKLEFPGGRGGGGGAKQKPSVRGVRIFSGTAQNMLRKCEQSMSYLQSSSLVIFCVNPSSERQLIYKDLSCFCK